MQIFNKNDTKKNKSWASTMYGMLPNFIQQPINRYAGSLSKLWDKMHTNETPPPRYNDPSELMLPEQYEQNLYRTYQHLNKTGNWDHTLGVPPPPRQGKLTEQQRLFLDQKYHDLKGMAKGNRPIGWTKPETGKWDFLKNQTHPEDSDLYELLTGDAYGKREAEDIARRMKEANDKADDYDKRRLLSKLRRRKRKKDMIKSGVYSPDILRLQKALDPDYEYDKTKGFWDPALKEATNIWQNFNPNNFPKPHEQSITPQDDQDTVNRKLLWNQKLKDLEGLDRPVGSLVGGLGKGAFALGAMAGHPFLGALAGAGASGLNYLWNKHKEGQAFKSAYEKPVIPLSPQKQMEEEQKKQQKAAEDANEFGWYGF
jgi:hypothetical protein